MLITAAPLRNLNHAESKRWRRSVISNSIPGSSRSYTMRLDFPVSQMPQSNPEPTKAAAARGVVSPCLQLSRS